MKPVKKTEEVKKKLTNSEALKELKKQFEHHQIMMLKAQGAIEVLEQMKAEDSKEI